MDAEQEIKRRILEKGRITFAEFMDLALFWPRGGYYSGADLSAQSDYYTSPRAHPAFGALLSIQMFQMWHVLDRPSPFWIVEMGAGAGQLCHDLVSYATHLPEGFAGSLRYLCLDRSTRHGAEADLAAWQRSGVIRLGTQGVPLRGVTGCFVSNELVDSFPVHRVTVRDGALRETYVVEAEGNLSEILDTPSTPALEERLQSLGVALPEGFCAEINLALAPWIRAVSSALDRGFVLTIDYGHLAGELYSESRRGGTLACYYRHARVGDPYAFIGRQDITAHVDFSSVMREGEKSGLQPSGPVSQREFLQNLGFAQLLERLQTAGLTQRQGDSNRMGMLDIVRTGGMGDFKALVQSKGVPSGDLWGLGAGLELRSLLKGLPVPLLSSHHMALLEGRYPHASFRWEELWPSAEDHSRS